jgi:hypothetical protein
LFSSVSTVAGGDEPPSVLSDNLTHSSWVWRPGVSCFVGDPGNAEILKAASAAGSGEDRPPLSRPSAGAYTGFAPKRWNRLPLPEFRVQFVIKPHVRVGLMAGRDIEQYSGRIGYVA